LINIWEVIFIGRILVHFNGVTKEPLHFISYMLTKDSFKFYIISFIGLALRKRSSVTLLIHSIYEQQVNVLPNTPILLTEISV